ncbi:hypothetical protein ACEZCY_20935 [Streptacidiphilus sp. N1-12]|uniref:Uncharacterized protein n=2 Tax=Streptacidiphilus alkalitolerans TaxID=3342712 RepID=A0ABV6VDK3_9ACTN
METLDGAPGTRAPDAPSAGISTGPASAALPSGTTKVLVLRAYQGYWTAQVKALDSGKVSGSGLQTYTTGAALSAVNANAFRLTQAGLRMSGQPSRNPSVTALGPVAPGSGVQTATITDCLDVTAWHQIDATTGQLRDPAQRLTRYRTVVSARTVGGVWMISAVQNKTGQSC